MSVYSFNALAHDPAVRDVLARAARAVEDAALEVSLEARKEIAADLGHDMVYPPPRLGNRLVCAYCLMRLDDATRRECGVFTRRF